MEGLRNDAERLGGEIGARISASFDLCGEIGRFFGKVSLTHARARAHDITLDNHSNLSNPSRFSNKILKRKGIAMDDNVSSGVDDVSSGGDIGKTGFELYGEDFIQRVLGNGEREMHNAITELERRGYTMAWELHPGKGGLPFRVVIGRALEDTSPNSEVK
jgi:hypothetical protein